jgi:hypothetical protein
MARRIPLVVSLGLAACGCAAASPMLVPPPAREAAATAIAPQPGCDMPGRERCGPDPSPDPALPDKRALACAQECSKHWMASSGAVVGLNRPLQAKVASLRTVEARLLRCFVMCDEREAQTADAHMPPGIEPCTEASPLPRDTSCMTYSCQRYGEQKFALPEGVAPGTTCELPGSKEGGVCVAGACVPPAKAAPYCSAYALRAMALQWAKVPQYHPESCANSNASRSCGLPAIARGMRATLLKYLRCDQSLNQPVSLPTLPWGRWPLALPPETLK